MIQFKMLDKRYSEEALGLIPMFLSRSDGRPAREQFNAAWCWQPMSDWKMGPVGEIMYPGESALHPIAVAALGTETIHIYPNAWVSIMQEDGSFEVSRLD